MHHVAIMKKSWGLTQKILSGQKTIESRWYNARYAPWNKIKVGDTVFFKDSGEPVTIKAEVKKVIQFSNLNPEKVKHIFIKFGKEDGIEKEQFTKYFDLFKNKKYCILVILKNPQKIKPFNINKTGFGSMSAWLTINNIISLKT